MGLVWRLKPRYWLTELLARTPCGKSLKRDAWNEGWDEGRRITVRACPDDFNPY